MTDALQEAREYLGEERPLAFRATRLLAALCDEVERLEAIIRSATHSHEGVDTEETMSNTLHGLVTNPDKCDELLIALDEVARGACAYEYGLPLYDEAQRALLRERIYRWAAQENADD